MYEEYNGITAKPKQPVVIYWQGLLKQRSTEQEQPNFSHSIIEKVEMKNSSLFLYLEKQTDTENISLIRQTEYFISKTAENQSLIS